MLHPRRLAASHVGPSSVISTSRAAPRPAHSSSFGARLQHPLQQVFQPLAIWCERTLSTPTRDTPAQRAAAAPAIAAWTLESPPDVFSSWRSVTGEIALLPDHDSFEPIQHGRNRTSQRSATRVGISRFSLGGRKSPVVHGDGSRACAARSCKGCNPRCMPQAATMLAAKTSSSRLVPATEKPPGAPIRCRFIPDERRRINHGHPATAPFIALFVVQHRDSAQSHGAIRCVVGKRKVREGIAPLLQHLRQEMYRQGAVRLRHQAPVQSANLRRGPAIRLNCLTTEPAVTEIEQQTWRIALVVSHQRQNACGASL